MRRAAILAVILLAFAAASRAQDASVTLLTPQIDLGSLEPGSQQPATALISLNVMSGSPWRLAMQIDNGHRRRAVTPASAAGGPIRLRTSGGGQNVDLTSTFPVTVVEGLPTSQEGSVITIPLEAEALWFAIPRRDSVRLTVLLNDRPVASSIDCAFSIAPHIAVIADSRPYRLQVSDPTHPGTLWFEPRIYHVTSNAAWRLAVRLKDDVRLPGTNRVLDPEAFVARSSAGEVDSLTTNGSAVIASGPSTGERGTDVEVTLGFRIRADEISGAYAGSIVIDVVPLLDVLAQQ